MNLARMALDWVMGCRPQQIRRRMMGAGWIGACCNCERRWGSHDEDCRWQPIHLCRRCVDERLSEAARRRNPTSGTGKS